MYLFTLYYAKLLTYIKENSKMNNNPPICDHFLFCLFRAAPTAYGNSQAKGRIGAAAASLLQAMSDLSHICNPCHSLWKCQILNPLSKARDRTHILMDTSQILNPLSIAQYFAMHFLYINHKVI